MQDQAYLLALEITAGSLGVILLGLSSWVLIRLSNVYSKAETKEMIDLKIEPLMDSLERHSKVIEKQTIVMERLNESLHLLHKDIFVVKTKVESIEGSKKGC